ncbi:STAG domain-containing protein [Morchella snyderi]|nr:STAG domain-containing protein [Morchella snyderi]
MKDMVNLILKCCGCEKTVTNYDIEDQDSAAETLSQIQEAFQRQRHADYPLTSKKPEFRRFRQHLSSFLHALMATFAVRDTLYTDPALIENFQVWIAAMSSSTLRQFRHTSTVFALDIVSSLAAIAADARRANSTTNRQFEAEGRKAKRNEGRISALETKLKEGEERREATESIIKDIFDTVFVHRYRDIDPKIRSDCVRELGSWILTLPDVFFDGSYLRYLGWVLSDTVPATRLEVVKALTKLFKKKDSVAGLRHFTERFRPRLVEMATRDADAGVRAATVELLDVVREVGYLEPADIDTVGRLLFDAEPKVRRAVVGFFVENIGDLYEEKLEELGGEDAVLEALGSSGGGGGGGGGGAGGGGSGGEDADGEGAGGGPALAWIKLKCLVEVLANYDLEDGAADEDADAAAQGIEKSALKIGDAESRFSLAGSVLWEAFDEVGDWEGVARYLLYDHSEGARAEEEGGDEEDLDKRIKAMVALEAREEAILLQLLNASVAANIAEGGETGKKRGAAKRTAKEIEKHTETVSRNLMMLIPPLLKKFGPVPDAASSVLRLEQLMKLDVFQELRQSTAYASLLDDINRQFLTHADESVLKEASAALLHAKTFEELDEVTDQKVGQLKDETVTALVNAVRGKDLGKGKFSDASLTELINTVRRLEYIASITSCVEIMETPPATSTSTSAKGKPKTADLKPIEVLMALLQRGGSVDELEEELTIRTMKTLEYYFMWKVSAIRDTADDLADPDTIDDLALRRTAIMERIGAIIKHRAKPADAVKTTAATTLLGLATLFIAAAARTDKGGARPAAAAAEGEDGGVVGDAADEMAVKLAGLARKLDPALEREMLAVFDALEKTFAKSSGRALEPDEHAAPVDDDDDDDDDGAGAGGQGEEGEEGGEGDKTEADESAVLLHEQRLCEFTGKLVLAVLAGAVDEGVFKKRLDRNVARLGPNYREIVAHLSLGEEEVKKVPGKRGRKPRPYPGEIINYSEDEEEQEEHVEAGAAAGAAAGAKGLADKKQKGQGGDDDDDDDNEEEEEEEEEEEHHDENVDPEDEEKELEVESDNESEPDPEVEVPPDEDEEMADV